MTSAFGTILRGCKWIVAHWYIPLIALAAWLGFWLGGKRQRPGEAVANELESINRAREIERYAADQGAKIANAVIDQEYRNVLQRISSEQKKKADDLRRNPGKRILYLRSIANRLRER